MALKKFIQRAEAFFGKISLHHIILLSVLLALISAVSQHGGVLHPEMDTRLPFYMSDTPLLNKLFDSQILEMDLYQARELSYVFDLMDSKFIEFSIEHGFPHFLSLTHYLFSIVIGCLLWLFCVKELNLKPLAGICLFTLFWTSPGIFLGGSFFRTAKIGSALLTAILFYVIGKAVVNSKEDDASSISKKIWFLYLMAVVSICYLDQQGCFLAISTLLFLMVWVVFARNRTIVVMLFICLASVLFHILYRYMIAPQLTFMLNGYYPNFSYQTLPIQSFINNTGYYLSSGLFLYGETFRYLIGDIPLMAGYGLLLLLVLSPFFYLYAKSDLTAEDRKFFILIWVGLVTIHLLVVFMYSLMVLRHPPLMWPGMATQYYSLPATVIFAMTLAIITKMIYQTRIPERFVFIVMCLAIAGNIAALPKHEAFNGPRNLAEFYRTNFTILEALKNLDSLNDVHEPLVEQNFVIQFFKSKKEPSQVAAGDYCGKGIYYVRRGCYRKALENFNKAILLNPGDIRSYIMRGKLYSKFGRYQEAIGDFNKAIGLNRNHAQTYYCRAFAYISLGKKETGCSDLRTACVLKSCERLERAQREGICR